MRAAVVHEFGQSLTVQQVPTPAPGAGEVLIRVVASGVCHTDLHAIDGAWPVKPKLPFIPGHEVAGYVAALGPGVTSLREGDRVGVPWLYSACGSCDDCLAGHENLCGKQLNTGYSVDGGYAEYLLAPAAYACPLPDEVDFVQAAPILCAGLTPYKGLKETEARPSDWIVISGIGGLGHLAVQYAKAMGLQVVAVDVAEEKLALARELGAEILINAATTDPVREVRRHIGGAHGVLITAVSLTAFQEGIGMLRRRGTCVLLGLPPGEFPVPVHTVVAKRLTIRGSTVGTRKDLQEALRFAAEGKVNAIVDLQPLDAINEVLDRLRTGRVQGRIVLQLG